MASSRSPRLVLASASATRLRALRSAGIDPEVAISGVDEDFEGSEDVDTASLVVALARKKATAVAGRYRQCLVLGCDSLLDVDGSALGKPASAAEAIDIWHRLSGSHATLFTGHCLIDTRTGRQVSRVAATSVRFGTPSGAELDAYVASGEPLVVAGAFTIDGLGAPFVDGLEGDPSNVLGLSLPLLRKMLAEVGVAITDLWRPRPDPGA